MHVLTILSFSSTSAAAIVKYAPPYTSATFIDSLVQLAFASELLPRKMPKASIHRYCIPNRRVTTTASTKVLGSCSNGISLFLSSIFENGVGVLGPNNS
jgi:hypothetical protein